ncbi:MAG: hypothetical protein AB2L11_05975 [Syntrophobacteraceae bacterium]
MKAMSVQQPFAFEILSGLRTIDVREQDTIHKGDVLICSSGKPAFSKEDMEEIEEDYGCSFLYGHALCIARLADVRLMRKGDEEGALMDGIDPEAYSWVFDNIRPVIPFPVKGRKDLFNIDDSLIKVSPFKYDEPVVVKSGAFDKDLGLDFSGWQGRVTEILLTEEGEPGIHVIWDSPTLKGIPLAIIERCEKEGFDWTGALLRLHELEHSQARDTWDDVQEAIETIIEEHPAIFEE